MTSPDFKRIEELFHGARELDPDDRARFLDDACGDDRDLRVEIESLLHHADNHTERIELSPSGEGFLAVKVTRDDAPDDDRKKRAAQREEPGTCIGRYKILQQIGEGGFGAVYMAEQQEPVRRKVALKIIKLGMDTRRVIARFEAERQALAMMEHPNIARVFDAGATDSGRPYFVMELVKGIPITEYCDRNRLGTRQRLELFLQVCSAVQHAHQKGIIHRDIKPSNVLVTLHDSVAVPKVIDFGIAKATSHRLTEKTLFTEFRQFLGTPEYMSPDQAEISGLDVDTRTDIYSLGVLLYELLTGTTPFDSATLRRAAYGEIQRIILETDPPKPSTRVETLATADSGRDIALHRGCEAVTLSRIIRGDLDWIVMKAMEKDRTRRYQTTNELANDVYRHLNNEPVLAGPPNVVYRFSKFMRRHRVGALTGALVAAALVIGFALAMAGFLHAREEARHAEAAELAARQQARGAENARELARQQARDAEAARELARLEADRSQRIADFLQDLFSSTDPEQALAENLDVETVVATARDIFGDDHAAVAATLRSRAVQLQSCGRLEEAEALFRESLRMWRDLYGDDSINVGTTLNRLGVLLMTKGDDEAAEQALRESLRIIQALPGEENLALCESFSILAEVLSNHGDYEEAEQLLRQALRIRRAVAPEQHLQTALNLHSLMNLLALSGKDAELRELAPESIDAWRKALPEDSLLLARALTEYGNRYFIDSELETAESLFREAAEIFRRSNEPAPAHRALVLRRLYQILEARGPRLEPPEYVRSRLEFAQYARKVAHTDHQALGSVIFDITSSFKTLGFPVQAIPLCREVIALAHSSDDQRLFDEAGRTLGNLAWDIARKPDRTRSEYLLALGTIRQALEYKPGDPAFTNTLGVLHYRLGRYEDALNTLALSDASYSQQFEGGVAADVTFIAMAHYRLGHEEEAHAALQRLYQIMKRPDDAGLEENRSFLAEAENLIHGSERGWK